MVNRACSVKDVSHHKQSLKTLNWTEAHRNGLGSGDVTMPPWSVKLQWANTGINIYYWKKHLASSKTRVLSHVCIWVYPQTTTRKDERQNTVEDMTSKKTCPLCIVSDYMGCISSLPIANEQPFIRTCYRGLTNLR